MTTKIAFFYKKEYLCIMQGIDIDQLLRDKAPKAHRYVPRFVVRALEKLLCVQQMNHILKNYGDMPPMDFIGAALNDMGVKYTFHGIENVDAAGRYFFASNHPLGGVDGLILAHGLSKYYPHKVKLIVNDLLMHVEPLRPIFVPVNKFGNQSSNYYKALEELYASDNQVITFPAGFCSRLIKGTVTDTAWRASFVNKAIYSGRQIVPVYVAASNSKLFYRVERLRRALGIKFNIGMLLLPGEMFGQRGHSIDIYFGEPLDVDCSLSAAAWTERVRQKCYAMQK